MSDPRLVLGCIADDVTGATDLGSTLRREGLAVVGAIGVPRGEVPPADAIVVALKTRTAPVAEAVRQSLEALAWLRDAGACRFYFKYCSTFDSRVDGNIGPVADAFLDALDARTTVVCPAFPETGRTVFQGHLFVGDQLLSESPMARHPLTPMTDSSVLRLMERQARRRVGLVPLQVVLAGRDAIGSALEELAEDGVGYAVVDAVTDADLRSIAAAVPELPLVTGASGLARGLPDALREAGLLDGRRPPGPFAPPAGPAAVVVGSVSAATRRQVAAFARAHTTLAADPRPALADPLAIDAVAGVALEALASGPVLVHSPLEPASVDEIQRALGAERAAAAVESALAQVARRLVDGGVRRLVVAGGETSAAVLQALGVEALSIGPDIAPGVPWCLTVGEPRLALALKSGNFGGDEFFLDALRALPA